MLDDDSLYTIHKYNSDRGFYCIAVVDACASYRPDFHDVAMEMIAVQGGIFGSVTDSATVVAALLQQQQG
jgi:biuret amidohydrolase